MSDNRFSMSNRPPMHVTTWEHIERAAKRVDVVYWTILKDFQIHYQGPKTLSPAKTPELCLSALKLYAGELLRLEVEYYPKSSSCLGHWLRELASRIVMRVMQTVEELETEAWPATFGYHGLIPEKMQATLQAYLAVASQECAGKPGSLMDTTGTASKVAQQLSRYRSEFHLTVDELSSAVGIEPRTVSRHLAGKAVPRADTIAAYEKLLSKRAGRSIRIAKSQV